MSVDINKMPKLGFGLMRLPENDGVIDFEKVCEMVDGYTIDSLYKLQILR